VLRLNGIEPRFSQNINVPVNRIPSLVSLTACHTKPLHSLHKTLLSAGARVPALRPDHDQQSL
jgi:hypothetical protein